MFSKSGKLLLSAAILLAGVGVVILFRRDAGARPVTEAELSALESRDGRFFEKQSVRPFSGRVLSHDPSGQLRSSAQVSNGLLDGLSEGWFTNGVVQVRESFAAGVSHGTRTKWRQDGSVESEASIVQGVIEGRFAKWHANGTLAEEAFFQNGVPAGEARMWYADGSLASWCRLEQGKVAESKRWPPGECREWPASVAKAL